MSDSKRPKQTVVDAYLTELVLYGNAWMARAEVMRDLKARGGTPHMIGLYMLGLDHAMEQYRREHPEATADADGDVAQQPSLWDTKDDGQVSG